MSGERSPDRLDRLGQIVDARATKLALVVLIILSVLPHRDIEHRLRPLLLVVFGAELAIRLALLARKRGDRGSEIFFVVIDVAAFVSFLPLERWFQPQQVLALTLLRLTRLLVLLRFTRELARDVYGIITRREQLQQFGLVTAAVFALAFVSAVVLSQLQVPHAYTGGRPDEQGFLDQLWWSFRQLESGDNLVDSVRVHPLILGMSLALTITGVFVISYIIGLGTNLVGEVMRTERLRPVGYRNHALVVGPVADSEVLIREFVRIYDKNRQLRRHRPSEVWAWLVDGGPPPRRHALPRMALLGPKDETPAYLYEPGMRWVVYRTGEGADVEALERAGARDAKRAILLANERAGHDADGLNVTALAAFRSVNPTAHVFVELLGHHACDIAETVGGPGTFPLDVPRFLGQLLCQHVVVPGVERIYGDLLSASGSEFYTHIFVDREELRALERMGEETYLSFASMARMAYEQHGVVLAGVYLGEGSVPASPRKLVGVERLVQWLNPDSDHVDDERITALGGRTGEVPARALRGLIAVAESYLPLRRYAHAFLAGRGQIAARHEADASAAELALRDAIDAIHLTRTGPRRVLIVGYSSALPWLLRSLARFVRDCDVVLVMGTRGDEALPLGWRLETLEIGLSHGDPPPAQAGRVLALEGGARVTVYTHDGPDLAGFAGECLQAGGVVEAAVFLSEPQAADRDARTAMRLLRFARGLESGQIPKGERLHVIAEFTSLRKGERIQQHFDSRSCGFDDPSRLQLTLVSTDQIKNYFMVHSAFVPGVMALYAELLTDLGQELVRLELPAPDSEGSLTFAEILERLRPRQVIAIAVELSDGRVLLNPQPSLRLQLRELRAVFAIADAGQLLAHFP